MSDANSGNNKNELTKNYGGEKNMTTEIKELLAMIDEYKQLIEDAENALDAAIENLEEALAEENEE